MPTLLISRQTPFERLYGKPPTYSHIRVFGCLAYATDVHVPHKFASRSKRCIFLGYPVCQKAYKLYDLDTHQMFTSRDVVFHETIFSYESIRAPSLNLDHVIPLSISDPSPPVQQPLPPNPVFTQLSPAIPPTDPILRRSQKTHQPPMALRDYVCNQVMSPTICRLCHQVHKKVHDIPFAILSLIIVTHHNIAPLLLLSVKILSLHLMPKQLPIPIGKSNAI